MEGKMKVYCCCCARQIVNNYPAYVSNDYIVTDLAPIVMGPRKYCCHECGKDLDENGNFPGET
jgi:hypothetical protein